MNRVKWESTSGMQAPGSDQYQQIRGVQDVIHKKSIRNESKEPQVGI